MEKSKPSVVAGVERSVADVETFVAEIVVIETLRTVKTFVCKVFVGLLRLCPLLGRLFFYKNLCRSIADGACDLRLLEILSGNHLFEFNVERTVVESIEDEFQTHGNIVEQTAQRGFVHSVNVLVIRRKAHILTCYLALLLPLVVCDIEARNLIVLVVARSKYCLAEIEKCGICVNLYLAQKLVNLIAYDCKSE